MAAVTAGVVASVAGGVIAANGARSAANTQSRAADAATAEQRRQYDLTRQDQQPWIQAGTGALDRLTTASTGDNSNFFASPDYEFRRTEGERGIENSAAARGGAFSGNALRALSDYNSNLASGEYGNWWNRQAGLAGIGQSAVNQVGAAGQASANNIGQLQMASGDARASGILGQSNAINGGINNALNAWMMTRQQTQAPNANITPFIPTARRL
jgi:hypothetical protein